MSNPRIPFRYGHPGVTLPPLDGGLILVHLVVNVEHWPFDQPMPRTILAPPHGRATVPDVANFSWVEYGLRCGLPRMLDAMAHKGLAASTSINASVIDVYPDAARAMRDAGWEFIGHGLRQQSLVADGSPALTIRDTTERLRDFTGRPPAGWLSPGMQETLDMPDVLATMGYRYVCDWCLDDLPVPMQVTHGRLLAMPYNLELNDSVVYAIEKQSDGALLDRVRRTLLAFESEAGRSGRPRVMPLGLHPHLMGVPHRIAELGAILDLLAASPLVRFCTGSRIADWYDAHAPKDMAPGR